MSEFIDIVFDGPPGKVTGRFVEVENQAGQSISIGEWIERDDGYWVLRVPIEKTIEKTNGRLVQPRSR